MAYSNWLAAQAKTSGLLQNHAVTIIPNPIDTHLFAPNDRVVAARRPGLPSDRQLVLLASQRITNENKGIQYLIETCQQLVATRPGMKGSAGLVMLGDHAEKSEGASSLPTYSLGYVNDTKKVMDVYSVVDVFVLPSLSENFPSAVMETMSYGVSCTGFDVRGIPEMVDHLQNDYVVRYKDAVSLAGDVMWILDKDTNGAELSGRCIHKVQAAYT